MAWSKINRWNPGCCGCDCKVFECGCSPSYEGECDTDPKMPDPIRGQLVLSGFTAWNNPGISLNGTYPVASLSADCCTRGKWADGGKLPGGLGKRQTVRTYTGFSDVGTLPQCDTECDFGIRLICDVMVVRDEERSKQVILALLTVRDDELGPQGGDCEETYGINWPPGFPPYDQAGGPCFSQSTTFSFALKWTQSGTSGLLLCDHEYSLTGPYVPSVEPQACPWLEDAISGDPVPVGEELEGEPSVDLSGITATFEVFGPEA